LTGGIASGKSTVAGMFRELGVPVVDADALVHELLAPGGAAVGPILDAFGEVFRAADGGIDRQRLAERVFGDQSARRELERIVHPMVEETSDQRIAALIQSSHAELVLYDAALLVETGRHETFARLIVVLVDPVTQIRRLMERDGLDADAAGARIRSQMPLAEKAEKADYVIDNSGPWHDTRRQVKHTHALLREDADARRARRPLPQRRS
jgi:dephospho-CoA kinase